MDRSLESGTDDLFANEPLPAPAAPVAVTLQGPVDLAGFRQAARRLVAQGVAPGQVRWTCSDTVLPAAPVQGNTQTAATDMAPAPPVHVPPEFLTLCQSVIQHRDPGRFELLYRLLWRLLHEPSLRHDLLDADMARAHAMAQAVRLDQRNMKALLRFRSVQDESFKTHPEVGPLRLAWFEPKHHIVEALAPFFSQRFGNMRWAILTPERSLAWEYARPHARYFESVPGALRFGPGVCLEDTPPADASPQRWLSLYRQIFQPVRRRRQVRSKPKLARDDWQHLAQPYSASANANASAVIAMR
jgi:probable DNA metabolism protein